ncbi:MAG TPA: hypothetical protein VMD92_19800 [Acidobacteriaceae bacterium]|nr:hypothetical protein [Acidobacteriaceae bacterium]
MQLTNKQTSICLGVGIGLSLISGLPQLTHGKELGPLITNMVGRAIGLSIICMLITMAYNGIRNLVSNRKRKAEATKQS